MRLLNKDVISTSVSLFFRSILKITRPHPLSHFFQGFRQFLHNTHFNMEINREIRVLVCRIHGFSYIEIDICALLKQKPADQGCAVPSVTPVFVFLVQAGIVIGKLKHPAHRQHPLRNQVHPLDLRYGRDVTVRRNFGICYDRFVKIQPVTVIFLDLEMVVVLVLK